MITFAPGAFRGREGTLRQIPLKMPQWASAPMINKRGVMRRRWWNGATQQWSWSEPTPPVVKQESGQVCYHLDNGFIPVETCIALAWLKRAPGSMARVVVEPGKPPVLRYIKWAEPEDAEPHVDDEDWKPLVWRCGVVKVEDGFYISSAWRIRSPSGEVTAGFWHNGYRYAGTEAGLVNLTEAATVWQKHPTYMQPTIRLGMNALLSGNGPKEVAHALGVKESTAWNYVRRGAQELKPNELLHVVPKLVSEDLWSVLVGMARARDERLWGKYKDLMPVLERRLSPNGTFRRCTSPYDELGLAILAIKAQAWQTS